MKLSKGLFLMAAALFCFAVPFASGQTYLSVGLTQPPMLQANAGTDVIICPGDSVLIGGIPSSSGGTSPVVFLWIPASGLSGSSLENPIASPATSQIYTLTLTDSVGCTAMDEVLVLVDTCVSIMDPLAGVNMSLYPNPSTGRFNMEIRIPDHQTINSLSISSLEGKRLLELPVNGGFLQTWEVDLTRYGAGTYVISMEVNGHRLSKNILIQ